MRPACGPTPRTHRAPTSGSSNLPSFMPGATALSLSHAIRREKHPHGLPVTPSWRHIPGRRTLSRDAEAVQGTAYPAPRHSTRHKPACLDAGHSPGEYAAVDTPARGRQNSHARRPAAGPPGLSSSCGSPGAVPAPGCPPGRHLARPHEPVFKCGGFFPPSWGRHFSLNVVILCSKRF